MFQQLATRWARGLREWFRGARTETRETRGLKLLKEWLSPEQLAQYEAMGYFEVTGCHSGTRYRIHHGTAMNIYELDRAGRARAGWCFIPKACLAAGDVMLAQKIALETDERGALAIANNFTVGRRSVVEIDLAR
jgi:hypothetical protein